MLFFRKRQPAKASPPPRAYTDDEKLKALSCFDKRHCPVEIAGTNISMMVALLARRVIALEEQNDKAG